MINLYKIQILNNFRVRTKLIIEDNNNVNTSHIRYNNNNNNKNYNIRRINSKGTSSNNINNNGHRQRKPAKGVNPGYIMEHLNEANRNTGETRGRHHTPGDGALRTPLPPPLVSWDLSFFFSMNSLLLLLIYKRILDIRGKISTKWKKILLDIRPFKFNFKCSKSFPLIFIVELVVFKKKKLYPLCCVNFQNFSTFFHHQTLYKSLFFIFTIFGLPPPPGLPSILLL